MFAGEYLVDLNGTRAYRVAFPAASYQSARVGAAKLLSKPNIAAEIAAARRAQQRRTRITADKALRELARVGFADILDLFADDGRLRPARQIPIETRRAIRAVKVTRERTTRRVTRNGKTRTTVTVHECVIEYKFASKLDALGKLAHYLGLSASIPPLDALLLALPPALADQIRLALTANLPTADRYPCRRTRPTPSARPPGPPGSHPRPAATSPRTSCTSSPSASRTG